METKPGVKTTEFWVMVVTNIMAVLNMTSIWDYVPNKYSVLLIGVVNGLYALSRGQAKSGVPALPVAGTMEQSVSWDADADN